MIKRLLKKLLYQPIDKIEYSRAIYEQMTNIS